MRVANCHGDESAAAHAEWSDAKSDLQALDLVECAENAADAGVYRKALQG